MDEYLLLNVNNKSNNFERYDNKKIYTCVLTLDSVEPIFIKLNIDKNDEMLKDIIKSYLKIEYESKHELVHRFYEYCKDNNKSKKPGVDYTNDKIIEADEKRKIPKYVREYFRDIYSKMKKCKTIKKHDRAFYKADNKTALLKNINNDLECAINEYLNIEIQRI